MLKIIAASLSVFVLGVIVIVTTKHTNPLKTHTSKENSIFLMNASANAEKRLSFKVKKDERGYGYLECIEGKKNEEIDCDALNRAILRFAKEGHYKGFEKITLTDLKDKKVFDTIADDYVEAMISTYPTYFE